MWEIPFYLIVAPILMLIVTLFCSFKLRKYWLGPVIIFILLNIPTVIIPIYYTVGWVALLGWAVTFTAISSLIALLIWFMRSKNTRNS